MNENYKLIASGNPEQIANFQIELQDKINAAVRACRRYPQFKGIQTICSFGEEA